MSALRAEVLRFVGNVPDTDMASFWNYISKFKLSNFSTTKTVQKDDISNLPKGTIMPSPDGIKLGLANGKYPHVDDFMKNDEEIIQMFEGSL